MEGLLSARPTPSSLQYDGLTVNCVVSRSRTEAGAGEDDGEVKGAGAGTGAEIGTSC